MAVKMYYPELGEAKPEAQIEASMAHDGRHYFLTTPLTINPGRGIEFVKTYKSTDLCKSPAAQRKVGWNEYFVTLKAYERIKAAYAVSCEVLLD